MEKFTGMVKENKSGLIIWGALILNMMLVFVQRLYIGVMPDYLMEKFSIDIGELSMLTSAMFYGYAFFQIPSGILIDRIGIRKLNLIGSAIAFTASLLFSLTTSYEMACIARFLIGVGTAVVIISIMKVQVLWFAPAYFSQLSAIMALISSLGSLAGTLPLAILIRNIGVQNTLHVITGSSLFFVFLIFFFVRDKESTDQQNQKGKNKKSVILSLKQVLTNKGTYPPLFMGLFFISTTTSLTGLWVVQFLMRSYGLEKIEAAAYVLYFTLGFMAGSPLVSFVDRLFRGDYRKSLRIFSGIYLLLWAYFLFYCDGKPPLYQLPVLFFLMGVVIMFHLLPFTAIKEANALENSGIATSMNNTMEFVGSGLLNFFIAALLQRGYLIGQAFIAIFIFTVLSFVSALFIRRPAHIVTMEMEHSVQQ